MWTAAFWGLIAGAALLVGAGIGLLGRVSLRMIGAVMGFASGVLISAVAFELTLEAKEGAGLYVVAAAMLTGALVYLAGDWAVSNAGAHRRKSPLHGGRHPDPPGDPATAAPPSGPVVASSPAAPRPAASSPAAAGPAAAPTSAVPAAAGSAGALVIGALLDGIPESAAIGISLLGDAAVGVAFVAAVFLSNVPEGMAATSGLKSSGRSTRYILLLWLSVALASAVAAALGYAVLGSAGPAVLGGIQAFAAGAVLAMVASTMLPEAVEHAGRLVGLVTVLGFVAAVLLGELSGI